MAAPAAPARTAVDDDCRPAAVPRRGRPARTAGPTRSRTASPRPWTRTTPTGPRRGRTCGRGWPRPADDARERGDDAALGLANAALAAFDVGGPAPAAAPDRDRRRYAKRLDRADAAVARALSLRDPRLRTARPAEGGRRRAAGAGRGRGRRGRPGGRRRPPRPVHLRTRLVRPGRGRRVGGAGRRRGRLPVPAGRRGPGRRHAGPAVPVEDRAGRARGDLLHDGARRRAARGRCTTGSGTPPWPAAACRSSRAIGSSA